MVDIDMDGDGDRALIFARGQGLGLLKNDGQGVFIQELWTGDIITGEMKITVGNLGGDPIPDIVVARNGQADLALISSGTTYQQSELPIAPGHRRM